MAIAFSEYIDMHLNPKLVSGRVHPH